MSNWRLFLVLLALMGGGTALAQTATGSITILGATCAVTNACVVDALSSSSSSASIALTGTWTATVQFEASPDGGTTFVAINGTPPSSSTAVTSATANGVWTFNVGSMTHLRARASALASGTVVVNINASPAPIMAAAAAPGGGGTVTIVLGTTNQITSDGSTTTPTLSIPATFIAPGTIAAVTSISAPTVSTSGSNGGVDGLEGTGAGLTAAANHDLFWADSTAHRWKMNPNNAGALNMVGISSAGTSGHLAVLAANGLDITDGGAVPAGGGGFEKLFTAVCQNTVAGFGLSLPSTNAPTANCAATNITNVLAWATLDWDDSGTKTAFGTFLIPVGGLPTINFKIGVSSASTSQAGKFRLYGACIAAAGAVPDPTFNAAQTLSFTTSGTANNETQVTQATITTTGCGAGDRYVFKIDRDTTDTSTVTIRLHFAEFYQ